MTPRKIPMMTDEEARIQQLYRLLPMYRDMLRISRLSQYHFRLFYTPRESPYVYRADYWPRTGTCILLDDGKNESEYAGPPTQVIRRLIMESSAQEMDFILL